MKKLRFYLLYTIDLKVMEIIFKFAILCNTQSETEYFLLNNVAGFCAAGFISFQAIQKVHRTLYIYYCSVRWVDLFWWKKLKVRLR